MAVGAIGLALSAIGIGVQLFGANEAKEAQEKAIAAQARSENTRERAAEIDANRKRREYIRQSIIAKSNATAAGTAQNAQFGSALPGAYGQIGGQTAFQVGGINLQEGLAKEQFANNRDLLSARRDEANAGFLTAVGGGIGSLGGAIGKNLPAIGRLGF
jgi:hypothetical protein